MDNDIDSKSVWGPVQTSNFTCAEPNTYLGRPKLLSSTVDSDGRTLHVPNLIRGEKNYHSYRLKTGNKLKKVNSPSLEILVLILEIHCYADDSQLYLSFRS